MAENIDNGSIPTEETENENDDLKVYKKSAISVVSFKIVYTEGDLNETKGHFKPVLAHQIFGESESIFGYKSVAIHIYYLHNSAKCYVEIKTADIIAQKDLEPDNISKLMEPWLPTDLITNKSEFLSCLKKENHKNIFGTVLDEIKDKKEMQAFPGVYANYKITLADTEDKEFIDFHKRFESLIVWFIDAANFIDTDDERWMIFYIYEEFEHPESKDIIRSPVGFCTIYKFFCYPDKLRARISQFFILPTHHKRGLGTALYNAVVQRVCEIPEILDITVEEPTTIFQKIRDISDCQSILDTFKSLNISFTLQNQKKMSEYFKQRKLCKRQSERIYDILGCYTSKKKGLFEYNNFLKSIKSRIESDIERQTRTGKRFCNIVVLERPDNSELVEAEYKRYLDDLEPTLNHLMSLC